MTVTAWAMTTLDNIRAEMARRHKKQADLADVLGITQSSVSTRMNGKVPLDLNELYAIAEWLDVPIADLLSGRDKAAGGSVNGRERIATGSFLAA